MKASEEIRSILDRCKSGELKHDQSQYFCRTSRCLAGWKVHLDYCKLRGVTKPSEQELMDFSHWKPSYYAAMVWGLDSAQAFELFRSNATYREQYAVVKQLERQGK